MGRGMKRAIALCLAAGLLVTGCTGAKVDQRGEESAATPVVPQATDDAQDVSEDVTAGIGVPKTVRVLVPAAVETLDPYLMKTVNPEDSVAAHIWDTLVWVNADLALEPRLAEFWRLVNDTTWEFKLRSDVTFHDGEPFNAEAVKFSIERAARLADGLETFASDVGLQQVEVVDEYTVRLVTAEPNASVPYRLSSVEMLPPGYYGSGGEDSISSPVGSGPYRFSRWDSDGSIVLEANSGYWKDAPVVSRLVFRPELDPAARVTALLSGEAELASGLSHDQVATVQTEDTRAEFVESTRRLFIGIRAGVDSPLVDKRVRQALNYGVDVDALIADLAGGYGKRYGSWVNPPHNLDTLAPWPYDPENARQLLAEAGYADGFQITLNTPIGRYYRDQEVASAVAEQLAEVGVRVQVQTYEWESYVRDLLFPQETATLFLLGLASRGDGLEDTANLSAGFPFNPTQWQNADFEELVDEAQSTFNSTRRQMFLNDAQALAYEEAPWIWLWRPYDFYGVASELDWKPRPDGLIYLYDQQFAGLPDD